MKLEDVQALAELLMEHHGLVTWRFKFDNAMKRFGRCNYTNKTISLSRSLCAINEESRVQNTILHEIAHALAGANSGHDRRWRGIAISIGCDGERLYDSSVARPRRQWLGRCPENPGHTTTSHRRMKLACKRCCQVYNGGKFTERFLFVWEQA